MVNDDVIDLVVERLVNRIENVNTYILKQMGESIKAIRDLTPSQAQAMIQILKYGGDFDKIVEKLAEIANLNVKDILDIFEGVAKRDYAFAERFYNYNNKKYIPYKDNRALQNQVDSLGRITAGDYVNLTRTSALGYGIVNDNTGEVEFKGIGEAYSNLLDDAVVSISQGKETFDQAVGRHMKKIAESGLKVVYPTTYVSKTGQVKNYTRRLDSAVREAVRTGLRELHMSNQEMFGNEFGADGVEISVHTNPAPDHAAVQGKQFSNEEFRKFQNDERAVSYDGEVFEPTFNGRDRRAINQYNCYHRTFPIVLGVSKPEYSNEELENIIEENEKGFELDGKKYTNYEGTQLQRKLETKIREQKDLNIMAKASGNNKLVDESQIKINELTDKYKELCQISGLPPLNERLRVAGYRKSKVADSKKEVVKEKEKNDIYKNVVQGKDLSKDDEDDFIKIIEKQGYNGKPILISNEKEFEKMILNDTAGMYRGVFAKDKETIEKYKEMLRNGEFVMNSDGQSVFGKGLYTSAYSPNNKKEEQEARELAEKYAGFRSLFAPSGSKVEYKETGQVERFTFTKDVKIYKPDLYSGKPLTDIQIAKKGYDAYYSQNGDYIIILNRTKMIILDKGDK